MNARAAKFDYDKLNLYFLGDWHWGHPSCRYDHARALVAMIKRDPRAAWIAMGDLMENALLGSVGEAMDQDEMPQKQLNNLSALLSGIGSKCIGFIEGNHGARTVKVASINPDQILAANIGAMGSWCGTTWLGLISVQERTFKMVCHHTTGGGRTAGGKINALKRLAEIYPTMDIYVGAHDHAQITTADRVFDLNTNRAPTMIEIVRRFYRSGSLLGGYHHSYAEKKMMPPSAPGQLVLTLHGSKKAGRIRADRTGAFQFRKVEDRYIFTGEEDEASE